MAKLSQTARLSDAVAEAEPLVLVLGAAGSSGGAIAADHLGGAPPHVVGEGLLSATGAEPRIGQRVPGQMRVHLDASLSTARGLQGLVPPVEQEPPDRIRPRNDLHHAGEITISLTAQLDESGSNYYGHAWSAI
ncbi:hypothetical protein FAIPA1_20401 [Frankia sp. AiPs1]